MEWLMIIAFVVISIMDSKKKSDEAKRKREQRQQMGGQPVYRQGDMQRPRERTAPQQSKQQKTEGSFMGSLTEFLEALENSAEEAARPAPKAKQAPQSAERRQPPTAGKTLMQNASRTKTKKAEPQTAKKDPAKLPTKTLMEQRPDREKREEHTKVTASVKPLTANVKPLKNAFENDEACEHRIELNPNIQYSKQQQKIAAQRDTLVKTDGESIVQGIIWAEIMGKPKAYQNRARRVGR